MKSSLSHEEILTLFKNRFAYITTQTLQQLLNLGEIIEVNANEELIQQGAETNEVYFIISGRLAAFYSNEYGEMKKLNELTSGEFFGEMAVFTGDKRGSSVMAIRHTTLLCINGQIFKNFLDTNFDLYKHISATFVQRLASNNKGLNKPKISKNIAIFSIFNEFEIQDTINRIVENLVRIDKVLKIEKDNVPANLIENKSGFLAWLHEQESNYNLLLFVGDSNDDTWNKLILSQSDQVFLLAKSTANANLSPIEVEIEKTCGTNNLISKCLILDAIGTPEIKGSAKWKVERNLEIILHLHNETDYARIARFMAGKSNKLVLSGGGARGFAHLGVYKAMLEAGVPVDFVGGTSIGAIVAAIIALKWSYEEIIDKAYEAFVTQNPLSDYQFPLVSFIAGRKLDKTLTVNFGDTMIEDMPLPYFAVAANLSEMRTQIMDEGLLRKSLRASIALPTILPPVVMNNNLLFDGGLVDNMPFEPMQVKAQGPTFGVDLGNIKKRNLGYDQIPSNGQLFMAKLKGQKKYKVPSIYQIVMGTMTLASDEKKRSNINKFEVYIKPDVSKYGFLDMKKFNELIETGYNASIDKFKAYAASINGKM